MNFLKGREMLCLQGTPFFETNVRLCFLTLYQSLTQRHCERPERKLFMYNPTDRKLLSK